MGKLAFVFSGQGDQYPGMGRDLCDRYAAAREVYQRCDGIRPGTAAQCFFGTEAELKETKNTQPCLYVMETALAAVLLEKQICPDAAAGFSLGEVAAAAVCGVFDCETGFRVVCRRGELMQREAEKAETSMAAVLKLTPNQVRRICSRYSELYPVNYNAPGQITVAGLSSQMPAFFAEVKAAGGRTVLLNVKGAFHSPFMDEAAKDFKKVLAAEEIKPQRIPLYSNVTARPYGKDAAKLLSAQICSPVQWESTIRNMIADGVDLFLEVGPGKTLTHMIQRISADVTAVNAVDYLAEVESC